jgi:hypothetical protein
MQSNGITEQAILDALRRVPSERWAEVLRYLVNLETPETSNKSPPVLNAADLASSELVGAWKNRTDIASSQQFARQLRQQAGNR